jgi:hypothetical protein
VRPATEEMSALVQPQPMVRLHPVAFGPISVIFSVASTEPVNTRARGLNDGGGSSSQGWGCE